MAVDTIRSVVAAAHRTGRPRHGAAWHGYCLLITVSERGVLSAGSGRPLWPVTAEQNTRRRAVSGYMEKTGQQNRALAKRIFRMHNTPAEVQFAWLQIFSGCRRGAAARTEIERFCDGS